MASGKRASMREGPLADLFRRTDEAAEEAEAAARAAEESAAPPARPQDPRALRRSQQARLDEQP
jgi:cell division protein FtsZ